MTAERSESEFILPYAEFEPAYMALYRSGELRRRACEAVLIAVCIGVEIVRRSVLPEGMASALRSPARDVESRSVQV